MAVSHQEWQQIDQGFNRANTKPAIIACKKPYSNQLNTITNETEMALKVIHIEGRVATTPYTKPISAPRNSHLPV